MGSSIEVSFFSVITYFYGLTIHLIEIKFFFILEFERAQDLSCQSKNRLNERECFNPNRVGVGDLVSFSLF